VDGFESELEVLDLGLPLLEESFEFGVLRPRSKRRSATILLEQAYSETQLTSVFAR